MMRPRRDIQVDDIAVARLFLDGCTHTEIATRLDIDAAEVSRSLKRTRGKYWKEVNAVEGPELAQISSELSARAQARADGTGFRPGHQDRLMDVAGATLRHLKTVSVIPARCTLAPDSDPKSWSEWMSDFSRMAAARVQPLLGSGRVWGVTWGSHVSALVDAITVGADGKASRRNGVRVLPLCGNRCGDRPVRESSTAIAERLGLELSGVAAAPGALIMVPAFIEGDFTDEQTVAMWLHIGRSAGYIEIFGSDRIPQAACRLAPPESAWVAQLDGVLTSVSKDGHPFGFGVDRMFSNAGYQGEAVDRSYFGDIAGVGLVRSGEEPLALLEQRWTGLRREELLAVAKKAADPGNNAPGVVVVASGALRATSLIESVRHGYVSHIIVDESLNDELARRSVAAGPSG